MAGSSIIMKTPLFLFYGTKNRKVDSGRDLGFRSHPQEVLAATDRARFAKPGNIVIFGGGFGALPLRLYPLLNQRPDHGGQVKWIPRILLLTFALSLRCGAELPPEKADPAAATPDPRYYPSGSTPASTPQQNRGITIFNNEVFDFPSDRPQPETKVSPVTGEKRYLGDEPDYNSEQRQSWIDKCSGKENFRDCFQNEKKASQDQQRQQFNSVERNQAQPYSDPASVPDSSDKREPAFGGVELEKGSK